MENQDSVHLHVHLQPNYTLHLHVHDVQSVEPQPEEPYSNDPALQNLHWSCWPEPRNRPKTAPPTYRAQNRKGDEDTQRYHWSYWPEPPSTDRRRSLSSARRYRTRANDENLEPTCDRVFNEVLSKENESRIKDNKTMTPTEPSDYVHYLPQHNRLTVNQLPRDTYSMYNQPRRPQSGMLGATEGYPYTRRKLQNRAFGDQYVHQFSTFSLTAPRCRGHFIIHPDWVSERRVMKRPW